MMKVARAGALPLGPAMLVAALAYAAPPASDPVDALAGALERFRGLGRTSVQCYRVPLLLPQDESAAGVALEEIWRSPSTLVLRGRDASAPGAVVRSLALYLEPLYVARTAILDLDWRNVAATVREVGTVASAAQNDGRAVTIEFPDAPDTRLPAALADVRRLAAELDSAGRLRRLEALLRGEDAPITVECDYESRAAASQPVEARWTLPSGERIIVRTKFRREGGEVVPSMRQVTFPSRFDPQETEEILVEYGPYEFNPAVPESLWSARGSFRFDANGLVSSR